MSVVLYSSLLQERKVAGRIPVTAGERTALESKGDVVDNIITLLLSLINNSWKLPSVSLLVCKPLTRVTNYFLV